jgi:hypothetical protein
MANLKASSNTDTRSELKNSTHIYTLLEIYNKSHYECYINYMEGFTLLVDWLCPTPEQLYIPDNDSNLKLPPLVGGYETSAVGKVLSNKKYGLAHRDDYLKIRNDIGIIIFIYCAKDIPKDYL